MGPLCPTSAPGARRTYRLPANSEISVLFDIIRNLRHARRHPSVDKVLRDVRNGVVNLEAARERYGVAIDTAGWTVDEVETSRLQEQN